MNSPGDYTGVPVPSPGVTVVGKYVGRAPTPPRQPEPALRNLAAENRSLRDALAALLVAVDRALYETEDPRVAHELRTAADAARRV